ncbi:hypothetical protein [Wolbachia endosymbiont (group A) of Portevinia maculata]|uniref:hypothetical protein n=1 Tax=Wolbachia endosymbiont (group A) of Portevinia maculata TaxID=3066155 RepID=UPI00333FB840
MGDEGAKALANGNLTSLEWLKLSCNKIGGKGAKALANGKLENLKYLDLTQIILVLLKVQKGWLKVILSILFNLI